MTLEEKVGQLFLVFFIGSDLSSELKQMINQYHVGGILLFNISDNIRSLSQVAQLINDAQSEAVNHGAGTPLFVAIDQEGGPVVRLSQGATIFPSNMAIGATGSPEDARRMAEVTAVELKALGINMNLAPVVDVNNNPDNPVIGVRSFGSSPEQVAELGKVMVETYKTNGMIATAKHFPGHGDTAIDSHLALPVIPHELARLEAVELVPFQASIQAGVDAIMTAHVYVSAVEPSSGLPATLSPRVLRGLLRDRLGFQGLIVTDSLGMGALDQTYGSAEAATLAFQAGADVLAFGADPGHTSAEQRLAYQRILSLFQSGSIPQSRLDESVRRILLTKARYGLLDWEPVDVKEVPQKVGVSEHLQSARLVAQDSITLVRNDEGLLPVGPDRSVLVIWSLGAEDLGGALRVYHPNLQVLQLSINPSPDEIELASRHAEGASVIVVGTINARRHPGQVQLVNALAGHPSVVVALGEPYDLMSFPDIPAYLASYGDVPVSLDALAQVLFGLAQPEGHLPVDLPGLYPLGYGMADFTPGTLRK
jgi:beta-N-acetylhexosaminidase